MTGSQVVFLFCLIALTLTVAMMVSEIFQSGRSKSDGNDEGGEPRPLPPSLLPRAPAKLPDCLIPKLAPNGRVRILEDA